MAGSKDSNGGWGQHIFQKVLKIIASFSEELLAHRCGISDVVFEEGCVILVKRVASFLTCFCNGRCRRSTCTAMKNWFNVKTAFASMDALKPLSPVDSSNLLRRRRRRLESSTFQKEYNVKQGRRTPPTLDKQN